MSEAAVVEINEWPGFTRRTVKGPAGALSVREGGNAGGKAVLFNHSILTSSAIWHRQAKLLADAGWRVLCLDTRGHGRSEAPPAPYAMDDLVRDNVAVLDTLGIERVHFVGVSQGGMTGLGLGINHGGRVASLCICAARADAPSAFASAWDERIALVRAKGVDPLAKPTAERWFGADFLAGHPAIADALLACIRQTSPEGFVGCAQAIQGLDYQGAVGSITTPTSFVVGSRDEGMLEPVRALSKLVPHAEYVEIEGAGHLPQVDRAAEFDRALLRHLQRVS